MSDLNFDARQENKKTPSYINFNLLKGIEIVKAISKGHKSLQAYLESHPNPHLEVNQKTTSNGLTPLHWAAYYYSSPPMIELLLEYGAHPNDSVLTGQTPLFILLDDITQKDPTQSLECMKILLKKGAEVNKIIDNSHTPLTILFNFQWIKKSTFKSLKSDSFFDLKPFLSLLLEHGANVNPQVAMPPMVKLYWCDIFLKKAREKREILGKNDQPENFFSPEIWELLQILIKEGANSNAYLLDSGQMTMNLEEMPYEKRTDKLALQSLLDSYALNARLHKNLESPKTSNPKSRI